jgi:hypothetical protein
MFATDVGRTAGIYARKFRTQNGMTLTRNRQNLMRKLHLWITCFSFLRSRCDVTYIWSSSYFFDQTVDMSHECSGLFGVVEVNWQRDINVVMLNLAFILPNWLVGSLANSERASLFRIGKISFHMNAVVSNIISRNAWMGDTVDGVSTLSRDVVPTFWLRLHCMDKFFRIRQLWRTNNCVMWQGRPSSNGGSETATPCGLIVIFSTFTWKEDFDAGDRSPAK